MVLDNIGLIKKEEIVNVERHIGKITRVEPLDLKGLPSLEVQVCGYLSGPVRVVPGIIIPKRYVGKEVFYDIATSKNFNPQEGAIILRVYEMTDKKENPGRVIAQNTTLNYKLNQNE